jgi:catechol 2,3-dioxygenase-like lactoylglutathione lyase family enzyme
MSFAHLTLATRDVLRTRNFFAEALGWKPIQRPGNIATEAAWLEMAPGQELHVLLVPEFAPSAFEREYGRHVAVAYPASGFAELQARLIQLGGEIIAPLRETPFARFFFRDPNGYVFEVVDADRKQERD